jgi:hypothetical protein
MKTAGAAEHSGAIILLHSTSKTNAEILGAFIDELQRRATVRYA